jgi:hypothetical protein
VGKSLIFFSLSVIKRIKKDLTSLKRIMYKRIDSITKGRPSLMGFFIGGLAQDSFSREAEGGFFVSRIKSWAFCLKGGESE